MDTLANQEASRHSGGGGGGGVVDVVMTDSAGLMANTTRGGGASGVGADRMYLPPVGVVTQATLYSNVSKGRTNHLAGQYARTAPPPHPSVFSVS